MIDMPVSIIWTRQPGRIAKTTLQVKKRRVRDNLLDHQPYQPNIPCLSTNWHISPRLSTQSANTKVSSARTLCMPYLVALVNHSNYKNIAAILVRSVKLCTTTSTTTEATLDATATTANLATNGSTVTSTMELNHHHISLAGGHVGGQG